MIRVGKGDLRFVVLAGSLFASGCQHWWPAHSFAAPSTSVELANPEVVVATQRLVHSRRSLPSGVEETEVDFDPKEPLRMERLAGRIADQLSVNVVFEDRPARDGEPVEMTDPQEYRIVARGTARALLDEVAQSTGFEWEFDDTGDAGRIVFYRYMDAAWRHRSSPPRDVDKNVWRIEPTRHGTVREVLEHWARDAGWTVVWEVEELDYAVTARAVFHGTFEEAVDALLQDTRGYQALVPTAWRANRYLTVRAGG